MSTTAKSPNQNIVGSRGPADWSFDLKLSRTGVKGRGIRVDVGDGEGNWFVTQTLPYQWVPRQTYYVAAVADTAQVAIYVDGQSIGTIPYSCGESCAPPYLFGQYHHVTVAANNQSAEHFHGRIDEVALYEYALSPDRIAAHYAAGQ